MKRYIGAILILFAAGCATKPTDLSGQWCREVEEPAMFLSGIEAINIRPDSTFTVFNTMAFNHADSALICSLNLKISVEGKWDRTNQGDFLMKYAPETLKIDADSTSFRLKAAKTNVEIPAGVAATTYNELVNGVAYYYSSGYGSIAANGGMLLISPQIIDSQLYARIEGETVCWETDKCL